MKFCFVYITGYKLISLVDFRMGVPARTDASGAVFDVHVVCLVALAGGNFGFNKFKPSLLIFHELKMAMKQCLFALDYRLVVVYRVHGGEANIILAPPPKV